MQILQIRELALDSESRIRQYANGSAADMGGNGERDTASRSAFTSKHGILPELRAVS